MRFWFCALFLCCASCGQTAPYLISPAPALLPSPTPVPVAPAPKPGRKHAGTATPTPNPAVTAAAGFYLAPFRDERVQKELHRGRGQYDAVTIKAEGLTQVAQAWQSSPWGSMALLWHRQVGQAFANAGLATMEAQDPPESESALETQAKAAGARYLVSGVLKRLDIDKRGADMLLGTNFGGTNYIFRVKAQLKVQDLSDGKAAVDRVWTFERSFYDPVRLGSDDSKTYPGFFVRGLDEAAKKLADETDLRALAGLPPVSPTPTPTATLETKAPPAGQLPEPTATPAPTPDNGPYWINPKTGQRVDPNWNFDPSDGTPRKDFVLRQPDKKPGPVSPTAPR